MQVKYNLKLESASKGYCQTSMGGKTQVMKMQVKHSQVLRITGNEI